MAGRHKAPEEIADHRLFKYATFLSRNKWRLVAVGALIVTALIVIGAVQASRKRNEARASAAYSRATTPKEYRHVYREFPGTFYGTASLIDAGNLLYKQGEYSEARKLYLRFLDDRPESRLRPWVYNLVGATFEAEGKYDRGILYYRKAEASPWVKLQAKLNIGRCYELKGDAEQDSDASLEQYRIARSYYRQLTETSRESTQTFRAWQRQAEERIDFLKEKEKNARERQSEKKS